MTPAVFKFPRFYMIADTFPRSRARSISLHSSSTSST